MKQAGEVVEVLRRIGMLGAERLRTAKFAAGRLTDLPAPRFADTEVTLDDLRRRIDATADYLKTSEFDTLLPHGAAGTAVVHFFPSVICDEFHEAALLQSNGCIPRVAPRRVRGALLMAQPVIDGAGCIEKRAQIVVEWTRDRPAKSKEVADLVALLASRRARFYHRHRIPHRRRNRADRVAALSLLGGLSH
jgi:hypothetical protein